MVRAAGTNGINYDVTHEHVVARLEEWEHRFLFTVTYASRNQLHLALHTLPDDLDAFVLELYRFCPDIIDQGFEMTAERLLGAQGSGETDEYDEFLLEGIDPKDDPTRRGLHVLRRFVELYGVLYFWWD